MATAFKLTLLFTLLFFLLSNAKTDKSLNDDGIFFSGNGSPGASHYANVLHGEKDAF